MPYESSNWGNIKRKRSIDRDNYSKAEGIAKNHYMTIARSKALGKIVLYSPVKTFKLKWIQNCQWNALKVTDEVSVPLSDWKTRQPYIFPLVKETTGFDYSQGSTAEYIGKFSGKFSSIPSKAKGVKTSALAFWDDKIVGDYKRDATEYMLITGGSDSNMIHLSNFTKGKEPPKEKIFPNYMVKQIHNVVSRFNPGSVPLLEEPFPSESFLSLYKPDTGAGGDCSKYFNSTRSAYKNVNLLAKRLHKVASRSPIVPNTLWILGARNKVTRMKKIGEPLQSRVVMQEDKVLFCLQKPFVSRVERWLFSDYDQPIKIGKSLTKWNSELIYLKRKLWKYSCELDFSLFDSTVPRDKIISAFALVRALFPRSKRIDNLFCYFCAHFLYKNTVTANGELILLKRGTPSGSAFTTIINSFANCIIIDDFLRSYRALGGMDTSFDVNGDDVEFFYNEDRNFSTEKIIDYVKRKYDMDVKVENVGKILQEDPEKASKFLKLSSVLIDDELVLTTPPSVLVKRLIRPQNDFKSSYQFVNQILEQGNTLVGHPMTLDILTKYTCYEVANLSRSPDILGTLVSTNELIKSRQKSIYFPDIGEIDSSIFEVSPYSAEKVCLYDSCIDQDTDLVFQNNWWKDNVDTTFKVPWVSRKKWLRTVCGERNYLALMCKNKSLLQQLFEAYLYGLPLKEVFFLRNEYELWEFERPYKAKIPSVTKKETVALFFIFILIIAETTILGFFLRNLL